MQERKKTALRWDGQAFVASRDLIAVEEPLEIRLVGENGWQQSISITMRSPGRDPELAVGFLWAEGVVRDRSAILHAKSCTSSTNVVKVTLVKEALSGLERLERKFVQSSSCGVCGKTSLEALKQEGRAPTECEAGVDPLLLGSLPDIMREAQRSFQKTGGLHAAGLFKIDGTFLHAAEDVGRHNAMDKLIGWGLDEVGEDWSGHILVLSGRASFELVQKAISVRVPIVASVGAPSTLAVDLAEEFNITLAGFVRGKSFNVYTHPHRIQI